MTLASPPLNLIGQQLISDLLAAVDQVEAAEGLRALVLRGEGKVFSAGADVALFAGMTAHELRPLIGSIPGSRASHRSGCRIPTLAAVHGTCMAGGFELALFCDLIWAAEGTMLGLPETRLGIVPLAGGVERIAARAGLGRARSVALGAELHTAEEFAAWGVIDRVLAAGELHSAAAGIRRQAGRRADARVRGGQGTHPRLHRRRRRRRRRAAGRCGGRPVRHRGRPRRDPQLLDVRSRTRAFAGR